MDRAGVDCVHRFFSPAKPPPSRELGHQRQVPARIADALSGKMSSIVRVNAAGETIVSVAVPIQRTSVVRGALVLSTQGGDIDKVIASERWALLQIFSRSGRSDVDAFAIPGEHDRRTGAKAGRRRRTGSPRHQVAPADS